MAEKAETYDVAVLGGGPGGYVAAIRASQLGLKTAVIEKEKLGGTCLHKGCIPTKSLLRQAEVFALVKRAAEFSVTVGEPQFDLEAAQKRARSVVDNLHKGIQALFKKHKIATVPGAGAFASPVELMVQAPEGPRMLAARHFIIATGSHIRDLPGLAADGSTILNSDHVLSLTQVPASLLVVGAGPVGLEFASLFHSLGSQVTVVEIMPQILPLEDAEIAKEAGRIFRRQGMTILTGSTVAAVEPGENQVRCRIKSEKGEQEVAVSKVLVAVGRAPASAGIALDKAGVATERGFVTVDDRLRSTAQHIYAVGDVTGRLPLAHVASAQGIFAAEDIAGLSPALIDYNAAPRVTYSHPEVAAVGLTEAQAQQTGRPISVGRFPFRALGRAQLHGDHLGLAKIVADKATGEILGAHLVGPLASELVAEVATTMTLEGTAETLALGIHPHPGFSEVLAEAARDALGWVIHA